MLMENWAFAAGARVAATRRMAVERMVLIPRIFDTCGDFRRARIRSLSRTDR
jgi:hypothetical protein